MLSIHSGEGDSLLVLDHLLRRHGRRPRIVMHELLSLDPLIDVIGKRLPNRFVDPRGGDTEVEIAAMSRGLGERDAVLIFPEGGNVTAERRRRAIERLLHRGHHRQAEHAQNMRHLGAPRPGGTLAALESAPDADVVFFAHHGFPDSMGQAWRELPHPTPIDVELWLVRADELPEGTDARIDWLFDWWKTARCVGRRKIFARAMSFRCGWRLNGTRCSPHATIAQGIAEIAMATLRPPLRERVDDRPDQRMVVGAGSSRNEDAPLERRT